MAVYDCERFVEQAIGSALDQDYPPELIDVVVVDDGSTDGTPAVLERVAGRADGRVHVVRQENAGSPAAVARAALEARGEILGILDADDIWPRDKVRRHVEVLLTRPEVALVYGDMRVIDGDGNVIEESWLDGDAPPEGHCAARLLTESVATGSSVTFRAALREHAFPMPRDIAYPDWWLTVRAAQLAEVAYLPEPRTLYRFHGANQTLGTHGRSRLRELRKTLAFQRHFLRRIDPDAGSPREIADAYEAFEHFAREAIALGRSPFDRLFAIGACDRATARAEARSASAELLAGRPADALAGYVRAAGADPTLAGVREGIAAALAATPDGSELAGQQPLAAARAFVVLASAEELLADPALIREFRSCVGGLPNVTLAVEASTLEPDEALRRLEPVGTGDLDLLALVGPLDAVGQARLATGVSAVYSRHPGRLEPRFGPDELPALRRAVVAQTGGAR